MSSSFLRRTTRYCLTLEALEDRAVPAGFMDTFEGPTLDPFWEPEVSSGSVVFPSTEQAHSGSQSVQLSSVVSSAHKGINLFHSFETPQYGKVSIWVYDTGAGVASSNAFYFNIWNPDAGLAQWGTWDYDFGRLEDNYRMNTTDFRTNTGGAVYTTFNRSERWHQWTIEAQPNQVTYSMDGQTIQTVQIDLPFTRVLFGEGAPNWRPAWTVYFDDFEYVSGQAPIVDAGPDQSITEGDTLTQTGSFTDPDADTWTATVDYGDGSGEQSLGLNADKTFALDHVYEDDGDYIVTVTVTDSQRDIGVDEVAIHIANAAPIIESFVTSATEPGAARPGTIVAADGLFTDLGVLDLHDAMIDWGDGSDPEPAIVTDQGGFGWAFAEHTYVEGGYYTVSLTVSDEDGGSTTTTAPAAITGARLHGGVLQIVGSDLADYVVVSQAGNTIKLKGTILADPLTFPAQQVTRIEARVGEGDDAVLVRAEVRKPTTLDGGAGNDRLEGGRGPNILLGGVGNDRLIGGRLRDLLIGGRGADALLGQGDDDLLVAGFTNHDAAFASLDAIMSEWTRSDRSYRDRVTALQVGGGNNGEVVLNTTTVSGDDERDQIWGAAGSDWFLLDRKHLIVSARDLALDVALRELLLETPPHGEDGSD